MNKKLEIKKAMEYIEKLDWEGFAKAYQKSQVAWHAEEWKKFIKEVRVKAMNDFEKSFVKSSPAFMPTQIKRGYMLALKIFGNVKDEITLATKREKRR
jgi:hypothetical protein